MIKTTYHRDGTITVWDIYRQQWVRLPAAECRAELLATLSDDERRRIARIAARSAGRESDTSEADAQGGDR